ncbi:MAG: zinc ribbon domain-containing protein [Candidatus Dormibacteraeota bacterium]|nr:zinc ribbon domain-containing protein [Candidatus Dormibacteraeota bacterium]
MPIYEYGCPPCGKRRSIFFRSMALVEVDPPCPECGQRGMTKLVSRVAVPKSEDARLEQLADSSAMGDVDENDPRSMARWAKQLGGQLGDEMAPDFDGLMEEMESGGDGAQGAGDDWAP